MPLTVQLTEELEAQVRKEAEGHQIDAAEYVLRTMRDRLTESSAGRVPRLSRGEAELLEGINRGLSQETWQRYHELLGKRRAETLTPREHEALVALSDQVEEMNARRMEQVAQLARLRHTSLEGLVRELGLEAPLHA